jgi:hypothetical protein
VRRAEARVARRPWALRDRARDPEGVVSLLVVLFAVVFGLAMRGERNARRPRRAYGSRAETDSAHVARLFRKER